MKGFLFSLLFCLFSVSAEIPCLEVNGITVKATDRNSLAAKQKALSGSMNRAFNRLLDSYFPEAVSLKNKIQEEKIQDCIYDYSIDQEKFSGKTYIAKFSFRFSKEAVQKILRSHNIIGREEKKSETTAVAIYTQDYLGNYERLKEYKVILFSPKRMVLEIPAAALTDLFSLQLAFEKINAEIRS
ncbi:MAG: hypothetical protein J5821_03185 [Alphaproteobacteria bacterium]|nr:hypothetical protein [Alphaproteobacteria bacterium]